MILLVLAAAAVLVLFIISAFRASSSGQVDEFVGVSGITTTDASRQFIAHYLATGRRLRTLLVVVTFLVPGLVPFATGTPDGPGESSTTWTAMLVACLLGTLLAELWLTRPSSTTRTASLMPRDLAAYLSRPLRWAPGTTGLAAAAAWAGVWLLPAPSSGGASLAGRADRVAGVAFGIALPVLITVAQRWILQRPQSVAAPDLLAADDATRAASVRMLAGIGTAMALLNLAGAAVQYTRPASTPLDVVATATVAVALVLAVGFWAARKPDYLTIPSRPRTELAA
jgi:hypothetical protein